jgi:hypothetical protein
MTKVTTFSLDQVTAHIVEKWPNYKPKRHIGKSAHVCRAIRMYNARDGALDSEMVKSMERELARLRAENEELRAQVGGRSIIHRIVERLNRLLGRKQAGR